MTQHNIIEMVDKCPIHHLERVGLEYCMKCGYNRGRLLNKSIECTFGEYNEDDLR